jgi:hypothetical protein
MDKRSRLSIDEWIILGSGVALLLVSFAPWYWTDVGGPVDQRSAWQGPGLPFALLGILIAEVMAGLVVARMAGARVAVTIDPRRWGTLHLGGGVVAFLAITARMLAGSDQGTWGLYLGLLLAGGLLLGGLGVWKATGGWWPALLGDGSDGSSRRGHSRDPRQPAPGVSGPPGASRWGRPEPVTPEPVTSGPSGPDPAQAARVDELETEPANPEPSPPVLQ